MVDKFDNLARILGILCAERGDYSYVDKIGYAPSKDTLLFYLKEAFRDFNSLLSGSFENKAAEKEIQYLNLMTAEKELKAIEEIDVKDRKQLREISSLISSKALLVAARLKSKFPGEGGEE